MMFNTSAKVHEFVITKDLCIFGLNQMQCVRKYKMRIFDNVVTKRMLQIEFPVRITQILLLDFYNY